jgi:HlyD family secretion protein
MTHSHHISPRLVKYVASLTITLSFAGCAHWTQQIPHGIRQFDLGRLGLAQYAGPEGSAAPRLIETSGAIEARGVAVVAELGGRVTRVAASEGDRVTRGQVVVELDEGDLAVQIAQAQAGLQVAQAELARARAQTRPEEIAAAQSTLHQVLVQARGSWQQWQDSAQARDDPQELRLRITEAQTSLALADRDVELAEAELEAAKQSRDREKWGSVEYRIEERGVAAAEAALQAAQATQDGAQAKLKALHAIRQRPLILEAEVHAAEAAYRIAQADVAAAQADLAAVKAPPLDEDVAIAEARVHQAEAALHTMEVTRKKMALRAPCDGIVSGRAVEAGEMAAPGAPLLTIADIGEVTLTVYVPETQIGRVRLGQEAVVTVDSYPGRGFVGQVTHIADRAEFTPRNVQTKEERVNTVFAVSITLPNPEQRLKPGMPADALLRQ